MIRWSDWRALGADIRLAPEALAETLDGGQAFRWRRLEPEDCWQGVWARRVVRVRADASGALRFAAPVGAASGPGDALRAYLGGGVDWTKLADALPWRSDAHLRRCMDAFPALRLLQQPFGETLLAFLCSATKQIPQIKIMCENLAAALGSEIAPGVRALPDWIQVASASETDLRALGLGFRAKNIKRTADLLACDPGLLARIEAAPYAEAKRLLVELPGVGEKIADCALLFGAGKLEAFPVDTWILKALERRYGLDGWSLGQLAQFGRAHFGPAAGYAQQFIFAWERRIGKLAIEA